VRHYHYGLNNLSFFIFIDQADTSLRSLHSHVSMSTSTNQSPFKAQLISILSAFVLSGLLVWNGRIAPALLVFCVMTTIAWVVTPAHQRTLISIIGIVVILFGAAVLVESASSDINVWFIAKIVFVLYFGVFVGQVTTAISGGKENLHIALLAALLLVGFFLKFSTVVDGKSVFSGLSFLSEGSSLYKWADLIEDFSFGIAGALAAELVTSSSTPAAAPSP
jgi:hypothetical protein